MITEKAQAKINLALDVLFKRADGYHEVDMIMQTVSLCDVLEFREVDAGITLVINGAPELTCNEDNLIYRAAQLFQKKTGIRRGVEITLRKQIPMEAGLAGGSADAAATLRGLNRLWNAGLAEAQMRELSQTIGSDVAFCITGGTARASGRGEIITQLPDLPDCRVLIFKPEFGISTAWAYGQYATQADTVRHPDVSAMVAQIEVHSLRGICRCFGNVLESVSMGEYPEIAEIKAVMLEYGALNAMMSGSGTAVFGIFDDSADLDDVRSETLKRYSGKAFICNITKLSGGAK